MSLFIKVKNFEDRLYVEVVIRFFYLYMRLNSITWVKVTFQIKNLSC